MSYARVIATGEIIKVELTRFGSENEYLYKEIGGRGRFFDDEQVYLLKKDEVPKSEESEHPAPKFKLGNVVSVYFDEPSAIGYNGTTHIVKSIEWNEKWNGWCYGLESTTGGLLNGLIFAREREMTFQAEKYVEPYTGPYIVEVGD